MSYDEKFIEGNHTIRNGKPKLITPLGMVLHHTGIYTEGSITNTFTNPKALASAHVLICYNGSRIKFGEDNWRMWHAGTSIFNGKKWCNNYMLGVEFQGDTNKKPLTQHQIDSFIEWGLPRMKEHRITIDWITDHKEVDISGKNKVDLNQVEFDRVIYHLVNAKGYK